MNITLINTGTELLRGTTINTNLSFIGRTLMNNGLQINRAFCVGDSSEELLKALEIAVSLKSKIIILTGGLGPTADDITATCVAQFCGCELVDDAQEQTKLASYWQNRHPDKTMSDNFLRQGRKPQSATFIPNNNGSAPGWLYTQEETTFVLLPGPPSELMPMFESIIPEICNLATTEQAMTLRSCLIAGCPELRLEEAAVPLAVDHSVELAYCAGSEGTRFFIQGAESTVVDHIFNQVREALKPDALNDGELTLLPAIFDLLRQHKFKLSLAESCTGGLLSAAVTDYAGVSDLFFGGVVSYDNTVKANTLQVPEQILIDYGAVSSECARAMADNVARLLNTECSIAVTGIAGPSGGSADKPVGLVYVAIHTPAATNVFELRFSGNRDAIRKRTLGRAWVLLYQALKKLS